jgi:hypothetical protein
VRVVELVPLQEALVVSESVGSGQAGVGILQARLVHPEQVQGQPPEWVVSDLGYSQ